MKVTSIQEMVDRSEFIHIKSELDIYSTLEEHPNITNCHFAFKDPKFLYLILDYCPGGDLFTALQRHKTLPEAQVKLCIAELILAYEQLHKAHIIHRGKPENIWITSTGHLKIADFTQSKVGVFGSSFCGNLGYIAPEVLERKGYTVASNVWVLGILTYELLYRLPFYDQNIQLMCTKIIKGELQFKDPPFHGVLVDFVSSLLMKDPNLRMNMMSLRKHAWFDDVDWEAVESGKVAPFELKFSSPEDVSHFDTSFTYMDINLLWQLTEVPKEDPFTNWWYDRNMSFQALKKFPKNWNHFPDRIRKVLLEVAIWPLQRIPLGIHFQRN